MSAPSFYVVANRIAARQHGLVTRRQLLANGIGRDIIDHWRMTYSPLKRNLSFKVFEADHTIDLQAL